MSPHPTRTVTGTCAIEVFNGEPVDLELLHAEALKAFRRQTRVGNEPMRVLVRVVVSGEVP